MIGEHLGLSAPMRDRWLLSYADLLTLLLAFFVVMYSISKVDADRLKEISEGIVVAFNLEQKLEQKPEQKPEQKLEHKDAAGRGPDIMQLTLPDLTITRGERGWVEFTMDSELLFSSGSATLDTSHAVLENMLHILASTDGEVLIEGHTDNIPINTAQFPSNWELSAARAAAVVRFVEARGIASNRLMAIGLGQTSPLFDNDSNEGRAGNRRVVFRLREANVDRAIAGLQLVPDQAAGLEHGNQLDGALEDTVVTTISTAVEDFDLDQVDPALLRQVLEKLEKESQ